MKTITHNGAPCIEARVHMLPTEDASCIAFHKLRDEELGLFYSDKPSVEKAFDNQHLYITTDEEIKEGDWVYWTDPEGLTSDINQVVSVDEEMIFISHPEHSETEAFPHECKKIIATTDSKLTKGEVIKVGDRVHSDKQDFNDQIVVTESSAELYNKSDHYFKSLPQIPQSFIEEYCKAGGIDKVLVEAEKVAAFEQRGLPSRLKVTQIKTDSNNCITIHPVEEKLYTLDDMFKVFGFGIEYADTYMMTGKYMPSKSLRRIFNMNTEWITKNL